MTTPTIEFEQPLPLDLSERCDRCGAHAAVVIFLPNSNQPELELSMCLHHWHQHRSAVIARPDVMVNVHPVA